ncbi:MAG TPA: FHA domain-containing protein [Geminocystis sp. M7585_C2015_104]|nr:FHA domain-containing protein [Geminocystis sp. M7585_C2015_104]
MMNNISNPKDYQSEFNSDIFARAPQEVKKAFEATEDVFSSLEPITKGADATGPTGVQLDIPTAILTHVQTGFVIHLPTTRSIIHIGKPNDILPPDIDLSGFPNSQIVSRVHACITVEGSNFYIEDKGSANGTYINYVPLPVGTRHLLKSGDRIAFGKGDKVSFIFTLPL